MFIAIDIGATNTRVAAFKSVGSEEGTSQIFETKKNSGDEIDGIRNCIKELIKDDGLEGIGIAIAMPLDENNEALNTVNLARDFSTRKIIEGLKKRFNAPVKMINDATSGGLAEATLRNDGRFLYLAWGTGLGGNIASKSNSSYEIIECEAGHIPIVEGGRECGCGKHGCLEAYVSGVNVEKYYKKKVTELTEKEWDEVLDYIAQGISKLSDGFEFEKVVFNGTVVIKNPEFIRVIRDKLKVLGKNIPVEPSKSGERSPVYGALKLFDKNLSIKTIKDFSKTILR